MQPRHLALTSLLATLFGLSSCAAVVSFHTVANPDGTQDTAYPAGNKPPDTPVLTCNNSAQPHPTALVVGFAYSHNVRQYLAGTAAATATLAVETVSGDDAAANGFAISGDNLVNAGTDSDLPGSGVLRVTATHSGNTVSCGALNWVFSSAPTSGLIKWNPGVYPWYVKSVGSVAGRRLDDSAVQAELLNWVNLGVCPQPSLKGIKVAATWKSFEGNTLGDYSSRFPFWDSLLAALDACNKYLLLDLETAYWGGQGSDWTIAFPDDMVQTAFGGSDSGGTYGIVPPDQLAGESSAPSSPLYAKIWQTATALRLKALLDAYGARYNGHARFQMMGVGAETAFHLNPGTGGYSDANFLTQMAILVPAFRAAWPNTDCRIHANHFYANNNATALTLLQLAADYHCAVGGPDTVPHASALANQAYAGQTGGPNYRVGPVMPFASEVQSPSLCDEKASKPGANSAANYTWLDFWTFMFSGTPDVDPAYIIPYVSLPGDPCTQANQNWGANPPSWTDLNQGGALDFFQSNPGVNTTYPTGYPTP